MKTGVLNSEDLDIIDWTEKADKNNYDSRIRFLILHHSVTKSAKATLDALNERGLSIHFIVEKDGQIYRGAPDEARTWHAGASQFGSDNALRTNLNDTSIGVEIVNMGDGPFPEAQMKGVVKLSRWLMNEHPNIQPEGGILGHDEIATDRKSDPSGYFDWKFYHTELNIFPGLYDSQLSPEEQKEVILRAGGSEEEDKIRTLQEALSKYGYKISTLGVYDPKKETVVASFTGKYDKDTKNAIQAFNRRFCPEVFLKEKVDDKKNTVHDPKNTQWYRLSAERLAFLLKLKSKPNPVAADTSQPSLITHSTDSQQSPSPVVFSRTALKRSAPSVSPDLAKEEEAADDKKRKTPTPTRMRI